jgi:multidrug efflux pump subunit AcrB
LEEFALAREFDRVGGFLPLLFAGGSFWPPLAIVIAGGATILATLFIPSTYVPNA